MDIRALDTVGPNTLIKSKVINFLRGHIIGAGVTAESVATSGNGIVTIRTGYTDSEIGGITDPTGGWPVESTMDIGTSSAPLNVVTASGVDASSSITSMDDLYVNLSVGGKTNVLRAGIPSAEAGAHDETTDGTKTHILQATGTTGTLNNVYSSTSGGGYFTTNGGILRATSTTAYSGRFWSSDASASEADLRGRIWFAGGIGANADIQLKNAFNGEMIFNSGDGQNIGWDVSSDVYVNGTNLTTTKPDYNIVPSGKGTIGFVDGTGDSGNHDGFFLHTEACVPASDSTVSISQLASPGLKLVFYGPIDATTPAAQFWYIVEWDDPETQEEDWSNRGWLCLSGTTIVSNTLESNGTNTGTNALRIQYSGGENCSLESGRYRIIRRAGYLESDLDLPSDPDPDVQSFVYYFNIP